MKHENKYVKHENKKMYNVYMTHENKYVKHENKKILYNIYIYIYET